MTNEVCLIIDAGGTYLKSALLQIDGTLCASSSFSTLSFSGEALDLIKNAFGKVLQHGKAYCERNGFYLSGVGVSIPGPFDYHRGLSLMKHKYQHLYGFDMRAFLISIGGLRMDIPIWFVHDVNAVLLGEQWKGAAQMFNNIAVVTLGTGLGFACALDGKIQLSALGSPLYSMYNRPYLEGILEDYVSQRGILHIYDRLNREEQKCENVKEVAIAAYAGDRPSLQTFHSVARILAENLYPFLQERKIECLLFGGQISRSFSLMERVLKKMLGEIETLKVIDTVSDIDNAAFWGTLGGRKEEAELFL